MTTPIDYDDLCKRASISRVPDGVATSIVREMIDAIVALREQVAAQSNAADMIAEERDAWEASAKKGRVWWLPWPPQEIARRFHLAYEQFAPDFGYETRPDTKVFDPYSANGQLMIAVVRNVLIEQASNHISALEKAEADNAALLQQMKMQEEVLTGFFKVAMDRAEKAEANNAALRQDAERYRFLRSPLAAETGIVQRELWDEMGVKLCREEKMDHEVDAAMRLLKVREGKE